LIKKLDKRANYLGGHFTHPTHFGEVSRYNLVLFVAIHAASGTPGAFFPHTHYGVFSEVRLNGKSACEMDIYCSYLGEFGVPVGLVSGEDVAVRQALEALPWAKSVIVDKRKETYTSGEESHIYITEGREKLREMASAAVCAAKDMKPLVLPGPLHFQATFRNIELANKFNTWGFKQNERTVEWDGDNMIDGFEKLNKLTFFPRSIYPFRRPIVFLRRNFYRIRNTYLSPRPNPEGAVSLNTSFNGNLS
jgi:D-amino peptidase